MASGSFSVQVGTRTNRANEYIQVWWSSTPDVVNNRSKVRVYAKMYRPWQLYSTAHKDIILTINGQSFNAGRSGWGGKGWTAPFIDKTVWVNHNADGKKSIYIKLQTEIKGWFDTYVSWVNTPNTLCKLDNLARKSSFSLNETTRELGDVLTVNLTRSSSAVRHSINLQVGEQVFPILAKENDNGTTTTYPYTLEATDILPHMAGHSVTAKVTTTTYNGNTSLGSTSASFNLNLRDTDKPILTTGDVAITAVPISPNESTDVYIQGKTMAQIAISPTPADGDFGAIQTYQVSVNGVTANYTSGTITTDVLNVTGTNIIIVSAIDGRGMVSDAITKTITVEAYSAPLLSEFSVSRCLQDGTLDAAGTYAKAAAGYKISSCGGNNSATIVLADKTETGSNTYTDKYTWTIASTDDALASIEQVLSSYSVDNSYDFRLTITDAFGATSTIYSEIGTEELLIDLAPSGVGIGKVSERENALEVEYDSYFEGTIYGTVQANTSDIRYKDLLIGDIAELLPVWNELQIMLFKYKNHSDDKVHVGLIAQDLIRIFEKYNIDWQQYAIIYGSESDHYSINYEFINQLTLRVVQLLSKTVTDLSERVEKLEKK